MSARHARPVRYRPGKAPVAEQSESSSDEERGSAPPATPATLPSHTAVPATFQAGVTIQHGHEAIRFPGAAAQDAPAVDLSEYDEEVAEASPPRAAPPAMRPITAAPSARQPATVALEAHADPVSSEYETESGSEESDTSEEPVLLKPVFVSRYVLLLTSRDRGQAASKAPEEAARAPDDRDQRKKAAHDLAAERIQQSLREKQHDEEVIDVDDTDLVDPDAEFAAWRLRELARIQRIQAQEREREEEQRALARRRAMPEAQRLQEDLAHARQTRQGKQRGQPGFLQKYHHKGAFFQEMDILQRDYTQQTESAVDKSALPKLMQVRDFGKRSRSKWTYVSTLTQPPLCRRYHAPGTRPACGRRRACACTQPTLGRRLLRQGGREPVEAGGEPFAGQRRTPEYLPCAVAERGEVQRIRDLRCGHRTLHVLLVCPHQHGRPSDVFVGGNAVQFRPRQRDTVAVVAVDHVN